MGTPRLPARLAYQSPKEDQMPDDKSIVGGQDRARVAGEEDYEVRDFANRHGLSPDEVREMIKRVGNDREALEREVAKLRHH
jgi:hypothetical protein